MEIDETIDIDLATLLVQSIDNNIEHFDKNSKFINLNSKLKDLRKNIESCNKKILEIEAFASDYDFDESSPGNGHRSFVDIFHSAVEKTSSICKQLITNRSKILFRAGYYTKYIVQQSLITPSDPVFLIVCFCFPVKSANGTKYLWDYQQFVRL